MTKKKIFAPQEIWDTSHKSLSSNLDAIINYNDSITKWLYKHISPVNKCSKSLFEIGCYPGRYMFHFGKLGYELNGIDQSSELNDHFINWLKVSGSCVGNIYRQDIFELSSSEKYDIVCSFGFIEHFSNFEELIDLHFSLTKPDGTVVIAVPDFSNFIQYSLHRLLDKQLLDIHNLKAMKPKTWKKCINKHAHEIVFDGHFGGFDFWSGEQPRNLFQKVGLKTIQTLNRNLLSKIKISNPIYSPFYGMIIKKK